MSDSFLLLRGVRKRFSDVLALDDITLDVRPGELLVVLGPTGAGKTTLLRTIAGLEPVDAGTLEMSGRDITLASPAERDVALVFQNFSIYPNKTVRQNLEFPLRAPGRNMTKPQIDERVQWAATMLRIQPLLDRRSDRLSGGQLQRVAIGRAIVRRPRLFLMDEPLTNLDAKLRESLRVELVMLQRELQTPMVYVTHDQAEALSMGDRVVVLERGRVLQVGTPQEIYRNPISPTVALQLGQPPINLIEVVHRDGQWCVDDTPIAPASHDAADRATLGIRPEAIALDGGPRPATVEVVENAGPVWIVVARWLGRPIHIVCPRHIPLAPGQTIHPRIGGFVVFRRG